MYGLTRGAITLVGVIVAGFLIWLGVDPLSGGSIGRGEFWWAVLMCALAGLVMALSQVLGGWTKWGWPRLSLNVFLFAFLPALIAGGWVLLYAQPGDGLLGGDVRDWSNDLGIDGVIGDLAIATLAIAFGLGLVFGLTFDTTGPRVRRRAEPVAEEPPTQRLRRRTTTTAGCGSTRAAHRRARAIPTAKPVGAGIRSLPSGIERVPAPRPIRRPEQWTPPRRIPAAGSA